MDINTPYLLQYLQFVAAYDCETYGSDVYNNATCDTASGGLSNTGEPLLAILGVVLIVIAVSAMLLFRRRRK